MTAPVDVVAGMTAPADVAAGMMAPMVGGGHNGSRGRGGGHDVSRGRGGGHDGSHGCGQDDKHDSVHWELSDDDRLQPDHPGHGWAPIVSWPGPRSQ